MFVNEVAVNIIQSCFDIKFLEYIIHHIYRCPNLFKFFICCIWPQTRQTFSGGVAYIYIYICIYYDDLLLLSFLFLLLLYIYIIIIIITIITIIITITIILINIFSIYIYICVRHLSPCLFLFAYPSLSLSLSLCVWGTEIWWGTEICLCTNSPELLLTQPSLCLGLTETQVMKRSFWGAKLCLRKLPNVIWDDMLAVRWVWIVGHNDIIMDDLDCRWTCHWILLQQNWNASLSSNFSWQSQPLSHFLASC